MQKIKPESCQSEQRRPILHRILPLFCAFLPSFYVVTAAACLATLPLCRQDILLLSPVFPHPASPAHFRGRQARWNIALRGLQPLCKWCCLPSARNFAVNIDVSVKSAHILIQTAVSQPGGGPVV